MDSMSPFPTGIPENLRPNPPPDMPEAPGAGNAMQGLSPFRAPLDIDAIREQLVLDRPLKLFIPNREKYPDYEFHIINSTPQEQAAAHNQGFREVDDPELTKLFVDLVSGSDKEGKLYRPILMARPKVIGNHIRERQRATLQSLYAGMDPANRGFDSKYAKNAGAAGGSEGQFAGPQWRIKLR